VIFGTFHRDQFLVFLLTDRDTPSAAAGMAAFIGLAGKFRIIIRREPFFFFHFLR